jgi:hypothetical protein
MKESKSNWLFIAPIRGLLLTAFIKNEIEIENVLFISREKLPRIRKKLGIPIVISELQNIGLNNPESFKESVTNFFTDSPTYAVVHFNGVPNESRNENIRRIERAINILVFSNLGFNTRKFDNHVEIKSSQKILLTKEIVIDKNHKRFSLNLKVISPTPLELNERWLNFHKSFFYLKLLKIISGSKSKTKWIETLKSVAITIGKSQNTHNLPDAFLGNMISMEMILTTKNDKISQKLIERTEFLLGWSEEWENQKIDKRLEDLYKKRCDYVHDGNTKNISVEDLIFTDDLLFNIINNLVKGIGKIDSKSKLIEFSDKYQCEKKLEKKSKSKFQPGSFQYMKKRYQDLDLNEF